MKKIGHWLTIALSFAWIAFVYASFYLVQQQRPFDHANIVAVGSAFLDVCAAGGMLIVGTVLGDRICRWLGIRFEHAGETLVWGTGVGLGAIAFGVLGIGVFGWLTRWSVLFLLAVCALVSLPSFATVGRAVSSLRAVARPGWGLAVYLCGMLLLTLLVTLTPPTDWDGLFYHLTMPRLYIEHGRIVPTTDMPHQYFPGLVEMLYLAAMSLTGDVAAKLLHFFYLFLLGGGIYLLAQRHLRPGGRVLRSGYGWPALTAYAAVPMVFVLGSWAYNDLALSFYQIAALYALFNWFHTGERSDLAPGDAVEAVEMEGRRVGAAQGTGWLILAAVSCGLTMGVKYTSFLCPVSIALFISWHLVRARVRWGAWLRTVALLCGIVALVAAPWYLRNLAFTGNPVYPFAYGLFGGTGWDAWRAAWYARAGSGLGWDLGDLIALPWTLTLGIRDMNFYDGRSGPLFLLALPFLVAWNVRLYGRPGARPRAMGYLQVFALVQVLSWTIGVVSSRSLFQSRLLLPAFVTLCAPLAYCYDELRTLDTRVFSLRRLIGMSVVLVLAANLCYQAIHTLRIRPLPVLVGEESREAFLTRTLGAHYAAMELVNERLSDGESALFLWEPRSYYCRRPAQPDPILERWAWLRHRYGDNADAIARLLQSEGYTHVLLHRAGMELIRETNLDPLTDADLAALDAFAAAYWVEEAAVGDAYQLYRLVAPAAGEGG